jgi:hypothetical protein
MGKKPVENFFFVWKTMWITIDFSTIDASNYFNMFKTMTFPQLNSSKLTEFSTIKKVFHNFVDNSKKPLVYSLLGLLLFAPSLTTFAFNKEIVLEDSQLYSLPSHLDSPQKIQTYLESKGSLLANYEVAINFEADDDIINPTKYQNVSDNYNIFKNYGSKFGTNVRFSQLIWDLTRTNAASGCSFKSSLICYDNATKSINPAYLLAVVQKESGLIYGANSKLDPNSDKAKFLLDRVTGYACLETKERGCFDENPNWKYYKGAFRQLYYTTRFTATRIKSCQDNIFAYKSGDSVFIVNNEVSVHNRVDGVSSVEKVKLGNAITCALYIYTPHINAQKLLSSTFAYIQGPNVTNTPVEQPVIGTPAQIIIAQPTIVEKPPEKPVVTEKIAKKASKKAVKKKIIIKKKILKKKVIKKKIIRKRIR